MAEVVSIVPGLYEFWEDRLRECEGGVEVAQKNIARLALSEQLQLDYEHQGVQDLSETSPALREVPLNG